MTATAQIRIIARRIVAIEYSAWKGPPFYHTNCYLSQQWQQRHERHYSLRSWIHHHWLVTTASGNGRRATDAVFTKQRAPAWLSWRRLLLFPVANIWFLPTLHRFTLDGSKLASCDWVIDASWSRTRIKRSAPLLVLLLKQPQKQKETSSNYC